VKGESTVTAVRGGEGLFSRFRLGSASDDLRKSINEVLPQFFAPMMRILFQLVSICIVRRMIRSLLEWSGVLPSAYPAWTVNASSGADSAAGIAVAATMGH